MTDEQIIKALEICTDKLTISCPDGCPFYNECENNLCALERQALDLINRQKAEIERQVEAIKIAHKLVEEQKAEIERLKAVVADTEKSFNKMTELYNKAFKRYKTAKSEAYKEFAERLKGKALVPYGCLSVVCGCDIDNLLKEMAGE